MITLLAQLEQLAQDSFEIDGDAYRHLFRARRLASGARLRIVDGKGHARWASVSKVERRHATLILDDNAPTHEASYRLHLIVAALRAERASWLVEKATELGVRSIRFISTRRTPRKYGAANLDRLRRVASAAVEQSHRSWLPEISGVEPWSSLSTLFGPERDNTDRLYLDRQAAAPADSSRPTLGSRGIALVGPEGGWDPKEIEDLEHMGCQAVSLGARTLRVETAAVAIAAKLL